MDIKDVSEFNDAIGTLGRMNSLWYNADESAMNLDAHQWYHTLLPLTRELITDMNEKEEEESKELIENIDPLMAAYIKKKQNNPETEVPRELYTKLHEFEIFLRRIYDRAGYKTKRRDDPRYAIT